jgi:hypothetical protein
MSHVHTPGEGQIIADRTSSSHLDSSQLHALVVAVSRLLSIIPAMIKLKMTAANSKALIKSYF